MRSALALARRALGQAWPNPAVGCLLVQRDPAGDRIVGRGWTRPGGRPHGETEALRRAGSAARGATAYVSLEPCNHHGKTPPCAEALVRAGIARAVIPIKDPDPRVSGRGLDCLRAAGVATELGLCAEEARDLNAGFFLRLEQGRPLVTLKLASSLDGRIATRSGDSRWITGPAARARGHLLRANHDAVMVGVGTALADDPDLTCRLPGLAGRSPTRVVMDSRLRLPLEAGLVARAREVPTWILAADGADPGKRRALEKAGVEVVEVAGDATGRADIVAALEALGRAGLTRLLVEGGGTLAAALLAAGLVDRIAWFRAPSMIGADGLSAVDALAIDELGAAARFERIAVEPCGVDTLETYRRAS
ncbi:MAG: bifunctional diaminohydroxyphosphoribosylaminopyrimidine deaminase/5-amino-6-(5-phosphoribosylamino)uracil reductase RibD [Alphaproteobacteria bacterium]|nr:bifunctional diaminohydroxyphosphoribosylaminopyrimidine deaminase/5-amino-6-(5-phosphoribosylamino)uracil reductase RibD [Alphaproteobacteria bacterium]